MFSAATDVFMPSLINPGNPCGPGAETTGTESNALALDVRGPSVTDLNRQLGKRDILEMPAPSDVHVLTWHNPAIRNPRRTAIERGPCGIDLILVA
jgi:hypothetical protein